eukprot:10187423-Karenia_brevis.AAC.1
MVDIATNGRTSGIRMNGEAHPLAGGTTRMKVGTQSGSIKGRRIGVGKMIMPASGRKRMMGLSRRMAA